MKRLWLMLIVLAGGCFHPGEQKIRPPEATPKKSFVRPVSADMVTPENSHKIADQLDAEFDRETKK